PSWPLLDSIVYSPLYPSSCSRNPIVVARSHRGLTRVCMLPAVLGNNKRKHLCSSSWFAAFAPPTSTFEDAPAPFRISASTYHAGGRVSGGGVGAGDGTAAGGCTTAAAAPPCAAAPCAAPRPARPPPPPRVSTETMIPLARP